MFVKIDADKINYVVKFKSGVLRLSLELFDYCFIGIFVRIIARTTAGHGSQ